MGVAHTRISIRGTLASGGDNWSCGFSTAPVIGASLSDMTDLAATALEIFEVQFWDVTYKSYVASSVALTGAHAAQVNAAGHTTVSGDAVLATADPGTAAHTSLPPECAIVVSLRTGTAGPRGRGRMYLPPCAVHNVTNDGALIPGTRDAWALAMKDFFDNWNADPTTLTAAVASNAGVFVDDITSIRIGNVVDSQRRRRNRLVESYASEVIVV